MKRIVVMVCAVLALALSTGNCQASWGHLFYSGYQPWWNIFAKRYKCLTPEEERLQKFWHDYYDSLRAFYCSLDRIDWVAYYKNHGYQINGGGGCGPAGCGPCGRINYAPVFVTPTLQWAVPAGAAGGPPVGPPYGGMGGPGMMPYPMPPMAGGPMGGPIGGFPGTANMMAPTVNALPPSINGPAPLPGGAGLPTPSNVSPTPGGNGAGN